MRSLPMYILLALLLPATALAKLPKTVAGITLGDDIAQYTTQTLSETAMGNRDALFLDEVDLNPEAFYGIRGGSISAGNVLQKGKILGIKIKFIDRSFALYEALEKEYRQSFGEPLVWLGDPFHNVVSWKWSLTEGDDTVEIILTHSKDPEIRPGVSIKMTLRSAWQAEYAAFREKQKKRKKHKMMRGEYSSETLKQFIPR